VEDARAAVNAAEDLSDVLGKNPVALANRVIGHLALASAQEAAKRPDLGKQALDKALPAVLSLEMFPTSPVACTARLWYYELRGQLREAEQVCEGARRNVGTWVFDDRLANLLYRRGNLKGACDILKKPKLESVGLLRNITLVYLLTDLGEDKEAEKLYQESVEKPSQLDKSYLYVLADFRGFKDVAVNGFESIPEAQIPRWQQDWYRRIRDYGRGKIDAKKLLEEAGKSKWSQCEAHFFIGQRLLGEGDRKGARDHFEKSAATRVFPYSDYWWSRAFLARMADPQWPKWIKHKN
jgi:tetratricopeptide (TPR) repeat protein